MYRTYKEARVRTMKLKHDTIMIIGRGSARSNLPLVMLTLMRIERRKQMLRLLFHLFMTAITGGLWLVYLLVKFLIKK